MLDKNAKRELKQSRKRIYIFLAIAFPVLLVLDFFLYYLFPSLLQHQWIVIVIIVAFGGFLYLLVDKFLRKREEKKANKIKKHDPYAD